MRREHLGLAGREALHIPMLRLENQGAIFIIVDIVDHLGAVDGPEVEDLRPGQLTTLDHAGSPASRWSIGAQAFASGAKEVSSLQIFQSFSSSALLRNSHSCSSRSSKNLLLTRSSVGSLASQTAVSAPC